jgi:hypothetical protein
MSEPEVFVIKATGEEFASNENYQMVNLLRRLDVNEKTPDPTSDAGSIDTELSALTALATSPRELKPREPKSRELRSQAPAAQEPLLNSATIQSPKLAPELAGSVAAATEATKSISREAPRGEAVKTDAPRPTGKIATMSPSRDDPCDDAYDEAFEGSWSGETEEEEPDQDVEASSSSSKRRLMAFAALIVLAIVSGAVGALATLRVGHRLAQSDSGDQTRTASVDNQAIEESIARIEANLASLKQLNTTESAKINDRIDKVEKAQAEPAAKLAQLSETVERLRAAPAAFASTAMPKETARETVKETAKETSAATPPAPAAVASIAAPRETTGSIEPPVATPKPRPKLEPKPDPKPEAATRLPTLEGWVLRDVTNDGAVIEGRQGLFEVLAGDAMPGLGRIEAIKRQDGRWVVVTTKGLIVAR